MSTLLLGFVSVFFFLSLIPCRVLLFEDRHRITKRLVGGEDVQPKEATFVVQLIRKQRTICSASIIAPETVVTAAHCMYVLS